MAARARRQDNPCAPPPKQLDNGTGHASLRRRQTHLPCAADIAESQSAGEKGACGAPADRAVPRRDQGWGPNRWNWSWLRQPRRTCFNTSSPGTGAFPRNIIVQRGDPHQSDLPSICVNSPCPQWPNRAKPENRNPRLFESVLF